ncbi:MAG: hypothetical protein JXX29_19925 [Deltaproteobacteria bacterium]|nr:hypothetical protein [Deltaproteobacteria bacterium]MBN2673960.1 hypothetical protein [Deltaproteobacteria bacterium]
MTLLFIAVAAGVLLGTVFLWLSGYFTGQAVGASNSSDPAEKEMLLQQLAAEQKQVQELKTELTLVKHSTPKTTVVTDSRKEEEIATLTSELASAEGERDKALVEVDNLKDELDKAKETLAAKKIEKPTSLPKPQKRDSNPVSVSEALDELQAKLDMEKVAHQLTKDEFAQVKTELEKNQKELEQVKKLVAVKLGGGADSSAQTGSRFKTMAIGMRSPVAGGADQNILRAALEKVQAEKDKVQSELERARKEIQLLKMRS